MLVLARKSGQKIRVGKDIIVSVISSEKGIVKLGITAPKSIPVHREEIYDLIKSDNQLALIDNLYFIDKIKN